MTLPQLPEREQAERRCGEIPGQAQKNEIRRKRQTIRKFFKKQFRFTPVISPICGESYFTVKTADFRSAPFTETLDGLRIVCGVSIRKSVNSAGLERDFFRKNRPFTNAIRNEVKFKMITGIKKKSKLTEIWFDETGSAVNIRTYNTDLKNRLTAYAAKYPARCRLTDDDECGCLTFEIDRRRFSVRLTAPYSEDRRSKAKETMTAINRRRQKNNFKKPL